jgi:hypothetical protein
VSVVFTDVTGSTALGLRRRETVDANLKNLVSTVRFCPSAPFLTEHARQYIRYLMTAHAKRL